MFQNNTKHMKSVEKRKVSYTHGFVNQSSGNNGCWTDWQTLDDVIGKTLTTTPLRYSCTAAHTSPNLLRMGKNSTPTPLRYSCTYDATLRYSVARFSRISCVRPNVYGLPLPFWRRLQNRRRVCVCVWRQQILNSIQRKSKLGGEEIQPARWPYRSQWLSGDLPRRGKGFLDPLKPDPDTSHYLSRIIGIHHRCYLDVVISSLATALSSSPPSLSSPSSQSSFAFITLMLFFQSHTLTIWSCWVPTWKRWMVNVMIVEMDLWWLW